MSSCSTSNVDNGAKDKVPVLTIKAGAQECTSDTSSHETVSRSSTDSTGQSGDNQLTTIESNSAHQSEGLVSRADRDHRGQEQRGTSSCIGDGRPPCGDGKRVQSPYFLKKRSFRKVTEHLMARRTANSDELVKPYMAKSVVDISSIPECQDGFFQVIVPAKNSLRTFSVLPLTPARDIMASVCDKLKLAVDQMGLFRVSSHGFLPVGMDTVSTGLNLQTLVICEPENFRKKKRQHDSSGGSSTSLKNWSSLSNLFRPKVKEQNALGSDGCESADSSRAATSKPSSNSQEAPEAHSLRTSKVLPRIGSMNSNDLLSRTGQRSSIDRTDDLSDEFQEAPSSSNGDQSEAEVHVCVEPPSPPSSSSSLSLSLPPTPPFSSLPSSALVKSTSSSSFLLTSDYNSSKFSGSVSDEDLPGGNMNSTKKRSKFKPKVATVLHSLRVRSNTSTKTSRLSANVPGFLTPPLRRAGAIRRRPAVWWQSTPDLTSEPAFQSHAHKDVFFSLLHGNGEEQSSRSSRKLAKLLGAESDTPKSPSTRSADSFAEVARSKVDILLGDHQTEGVIQLRSLPEQLEIFSIYGLDRRATDQVRKHRCEDFWLPSSWMSLIENPKTLTKQQMDQQEAIWELLTTAVTHYERLETLSNVFLKALELLHENDFLHHIKTAKLYCNIRELLAVDGAFWREGLVKVYREAKAGQQLLSAASVAHCFEGVGQRLKPYLEFCGHQSRILHYVNVLKRDDVDFRTYLAWCESQPSCNRLKLNDLLASPFQRLTKYPLLLKAIVKKTDDSRVNASLQGVVSEMEQFLADVNYSVSVYAQKAEVEDLMDRLDDGFVEVSPDQEKFLPAHRLDLTGPLCSGGLKIEGNRHLLAEEAFRFKELPGKFGIELKIDVNVFLLTDVMIITAKKKSGKLQLVCPPLLLYRLKLHLLNDQGSLLLLNIHELGMVSSAICLQSTSGSKNTAEFFSCVQKAQRSLKSKIESAKSPSLSEGTSPRFSIFRDRVASDSASHRPGNLVKSATNLCGSSPDFSNISEIMV